MSLAKSCLSEIWIEDQTALYWVGYSSCKTKFNAGLKIDLSKPAIYPHPFVLQSMAAFILRNTSVCATGIFNNQQAKVLLNEKNVKVLLTPTTTFFYDNQGKLTQIFHNTPKF